MAWPTIYSKGYWDASFGLNYETGRLESWINNANQLISATAVSLNQWSHVALVYDGSNRTFYINGVPAGGGSAPTVAPDNAPSAIGTVATIDSRSSFNGIIDEVSLYSRALSANNIAAIYLAGAYGKCQAAPALLAFDTSRTNLYWTPNGLRLRLNGLDGHGAVVLYGSTDLHSWTPLYTNPPATGSLDFLDSAATNYRTRFYRAEAH